MAASDAKPVPIKNTAYRVTFPIYDADGDLVTGATGLDSEVSKDAGTFADCTNEATEIATSSGIYYLDLTSTEMNADCVAVIVKTSSSGAKTTVLIMYPQESGDVKATVEDYASGKAPLQPTTAGRTLDVTATGAAGIDWGNVENPTTTVNLSGTTISTSQAVASVSGAVGSVTGAVGSVTGNVGGNVVGSVGSISGVTFPTNFAALGINASGHVSRVTLADTITTYTGNTPQTGDAYARIGATGSGLTSLAPAATALSTATWTATRAGYLDNLSGGAVMLAASYSAPPSAAANAGAVRTELATELGRIDVATSTRLASASYSAPPSAGTISTTVWSDVSRTLTAFGFTVSTNDAASISAIKAKTDNLPSDPADASDIAAAFSTVNSTLSTIASYVDTEVASILAAVDTEVAAIKAKTDNLPTSPAAAGDIPSAATIATQVRTELATELARVDVAISTRLASASYTVPLDAAGVRSAVGLASANIDTQLGDIPTVAEFEARTLLASAYATASLLTTVAGYLDTEIAAILEDTGTTIPALIAALPAPMTAAQTRTALGMESADLDTQLDAILAASGGGGGGSGSGAYTLTITVNDGSAALQNATVRLTEGSTSLSGTTNASGQVAFSVDAATWSVAITKDGYQFTPTTKVVAGSGSQTYSMTAVSISPPAGPTQSTVVVTVRNSAGTAMKDVNVKVRIKEPPPGEDGAAYTNEWLSYKATDAGVVTMTLVRNATYELQVFGYPSLHEFTPSTATYEIPNLVAS